MYIVREESRRPETSSSSFPTALVVLAVSCLSISHLYCLTQEPFGDACMSVYHDDAIILGPDVGHKLEGSGEFWVGGRRRPPR